jgi:hypothetical protein
MFWRHIHLFISVLIQHSQRVTPLCTDQANQIHPSAVRSRGRQVHKQITNQTELPKKARDQRRKWEWSEEAEFKLKPRQWAQKEVLGVKELEGRRGTKMGACTHFHMLSFCLGVKHILLLSCLSSGGKQVLPWGLRGGVPSPSKASILTALVS